jgi:starch-binding outer membrane protein, SusD/RagB family
MRNFIIILTVAVFLAGLVGCEKFVSGFEANPLLPADASALKIFVGAQLAADIVHEGFPAFLSGVWTQQIYGADRQFISYQTYTVTTDDFLNEWPTAYANVLSNLRVVQGKAGDLGQLNLKGAAEILEGYHMGNVAALWGDVPYSEANSPPNFNPHFDPQLSVYAAVQKVLDQGIADFNSNPVPLAQDATNMGGSATRWVKFAHSVKARYLMHTARSQGYSAALLTQIIAETGQGITSLTGSEDAMATHGTIQGQSQNLWYSFMAQDRTGYMDASNTFVIPMMRAMKFDGKSNEAGRLAFYFNAAQNNMNTTATGAYAVGASYPFFRASETHLLMAEAYVRSGNTASALTELNNARTYNNNVFKNTSAAFVAADFPTTAALQQAILNETYVSLMHQTEAFNFLRRIDYAISYKDSAGVTKTLAPTKGTVWPQRFLYGTSEINSNTNCPGEPTNGQFNKTAANK